MPNHSILIVDDIPDIRIIINRFLAIAGYTLLEAASGPEAIGIARARRPNLILIDLGLPGLDGWETIRRMRAEPALEETPIVAMTGYTMMSAVQAARNAGCQHVLLKPLNLDFMLQQLPVWIEQPINRDLPNTLHEREHGAVQRPSLARGTLRTLPT